MNKQKYFETHTRKPDAWKVYFNYFTYTWIWILADNVILLIFSFVIKPLPINYAVFCIMRRIQTIEDFKVQDIAGWERIF